MRFLKQAKSSDPQTILSTLCKQETNLFYASMVIWNGLLGVMTYYKLASAHLPLVWVIFPLVIRGVIWENLVQKNRCVTKNIGQFVVCYFASVLVPLCFNSYMVVTVLELFIPIMGRSGSHTIPDLFIAGIVSAFVIMQTSYVVSLSIFANS